MDIFWNALTLEQRQTRHREYPWWSVSSSRGVGRVWTARSGWRVLGFGYPGQVLVVPPGVVLRGALKRVTSDMPPPAGVKVYRQEGFLLEAYGYFTELEPRTLEDVLREVSVQHPDPVPEPMAGDVWGLESGRVVQITDVEPSNWGTGSWHVSFGQGRPTPFALEPVSPDGRSILGAKWPPRIPGQEEDVHWARLRPEPWCPVDWLTRQN